MLGTQPADAGLLGASVPSVRRTGKRRVAAVLLLLGAVAYLCSDVSPIGALLPAVRPGAPLPRAPAGSDQGLLAALKRGTGALFMQATDEAKVPLKCDVRKLPRSAIALDIEVSKEIADQIHMKTMNDLAKQAKIPGFRPGKVPPQAVVAKIGMKKVKEATVESIVDMGMQKSGVGQKIQTVGDARLPEDLEKVAERYKPGESLAFTVEVDVYPECPVEEAKYSALEVEVEEAEMNEDGYNNALMKLQKRHADIVPTGPGVPAELGMQVVVDMQGFLEKADGSKGDPLPSVAGGEDVEVLLEQGKFMPGLVEGLVGATDGEKREIRVTFPPRSSVPQLAGAKAVFDVDCKKVQRREMPEPGDEFADRVKPGMTWEELDAKLREGMQIEAEERVAQNKRRALRKALVESLPEEFEIPETLLEQVVKERFAVMLGDLREKGSTDEKIQELITPENYKQFKEISRPGATATIKGDLAIKAVQAQQGLSVPRDQIDDEVMTLQAQAMQRKEKFKESEVRPRVEMQMEQDLVLDWLSAKAKVTMIAPKGEDERIEEQLGQSPEELAEKMREIVS